MSFFTSAQDLAVEWTPEELAHAAKRERCLESACESPAETALLHSLLKRFEPSEVAAQVKIGRFRIDFVTRGATAWEIDGKAYHDEARDRRRDQWILANSPITGIVRIQAAAFHWFRDACLAAIGNFVPEFKPWRCAARDEDSIKAADAYLLDEKSRGGPLAWDVEDIAAGEAYRIVDCLDEWTGVIGSPMAFLRDNPAYQMLTAKSQKLYGWKGKVVFRGNLRPLPARADALQQIIPEGFLRS